MNRLSTGERAAIVRALVEGISMRATCRLTGAAKGTVTKLLTELGPACVEYMDAVMRDLPCRRIQVDEIWTFVGCKEKRVTETKKLAGQGDAWTFVAICQDTKLIPTWVVGQRSADNATALMLDLAPRLTNRPQISTDGHQIYGDAIRIAFEGRVDYGQIVKEYGESDEPQKRYSPARVLSITRRKVIGDPNERDISTSHVERANLTIRMSNRRFTRLTNGFSKKLYNLECAVALHFVWYNFGRPHQSLGGLTPAQAAGMSKWRWTAEDVVQQLEAKEQKGAA